MSRSRLFVVFVFIFVSFFSSLLLSQVSSDAIPVSMSKRVVAPDRADSDYFGCSVAIGGDLLVVGAYGNDLRNTNEGTVYIFGRDQGGADNWGIIKRMVAPDRADGDNFGRDVAIDGNMIIVGAPGNDLAGGNQGAAYIFERNTGGSENWGFVKRLVASDGNTGDSFGYSVDINGDYAVVGAYANDVNEFNDGAAYIFSRNNGGADNWGEVKRLLPSDPAYMDNFGFDVAISTTTVVVGAYFNDLKDTDEGTAYIFYKDQGGVDNWGQVKRLRAPDRDANDYFGCAVDIDGDTVVIGAFGNDISAIDDGAAYVFYRNTGGADTWGYVRRLLASDRADGDQFGESIAISGDYVLVGSPRRDSPGQYAGGAYLFFRNQGGADRWRQVKRLLAFDRAAEDQYGKAVAINGDDVVVGAYHNSLKASYEGTAYVYKK